MENHSILLTEQGEDMTGKQRAALRAMANELQPIIFIGKEGITEQLINDANNALEARELVKGTVLKSNDLDARDVVQILCDELNAEPIQTIGRRFVIYRRSKEHPKIEL